MSPKQENYAINDFDIVRYIVDTRYSQIKQYTIGFYWWKS